MDKQSSTHVVNMVVDAYFISVALTGHNFRREWEHTAACRTPSNGPCLVVISWSYNKLYCEWEERRA